MKTNLAASVRQRLLDLSRRQKRPFQEVLQYYAMERFLYRLSQSQHAEQFILKGALMLRVWHSPETRPTMDIDLLGRASNNREAVLEQIREVLGQHVPADGLEFDADTLKAEAITEDADYQGIRVRFTALLDSARVRLQLDIGFGDIVHPAPQRSAFPVLLDFPAPEILCYSRESAIAEKFQAMVKLGELNSRMKDFYDIWLLSRQFDFEMESLKMAVESTFNQRGTAMPALPLFSTSFVSNRQRLWQAFRQRLEQEQVPGDFNSITEAMGDFLGPVINSSGTKQSEYWPAAGPWRKGSRNRQ